MTIIGLSTSFLRTMAILVRMNIMADYGNPTGRLEWTSQAYDLTSSAIRHWDFQAAQGVQVSHVAQLIYNQH